MKSRLKTCSRGSACNFLHCFSNPGGDYEWADCDKPPPRYWVKKMIALFGYSDEQIQQPSPKDQHKRIFTSDRDSYHHKRHRSIETNRHDGGSRRSHHEENRDRKSKHQKDDKSYENRNEYKNNHCSNVTNEDTDSDGDWLHRRHRSRSNRRESKSRDYGSRSRRSERSSSDDDLYTERRVYSKRRSQSNDDGESDGAKHEQPRSTTHEDVDPRQSENEPFAKKHKRRNKKTVTDNYLEGCNRHRYNRSRSRDMSDRWEPDSSPDEESSSKVSGADDQIPDETKSKYRRSSHERSSSSFERESKNSQGGEIRQSQDRNHGMREKRKRI